MTVDLVSWGRVAVRPTVSPTRDRVAGKGAGFPPEPSPLFRFTENSTAVCVRGAHARPRARSPPHRNLLRYSDLQKIAQPCACAAHMRGRVRAHHRHPHSWPCTHSVVPPTRSLAAHTLTHTRTHGRAPLGRLPCTHQHSLPRMHPLCGHATHSVVGCACTRTHGSWPRTHSVASRACTHKSWQRTHPQIRNPGRARTRTPGRARTWSCRHTPHRRRHMPPQHTSPRRRHMPCRHPLAAPAP